MISLSFPPKPVIDNSSFFLIFDRTDPGTLEPWNPEPGTRNLWNPEPGTFGTWDLWNQKPGTRNKKTTLIMKRIVFLVALISTLFSLSPLKAQYVPDPDPLLQQKLEAWKDLKFGLLMHWGAYSQWGVVESWSICAEDEGWCRRKTDDYEAYKKEYEALKTTFNPIHFDPEKWASAAKNAGMRYVVFTTKHHDGFCMFDTKMTDYKVTDPGCPFHSHPKANIAGEIFSAFRAEGLWTGAYFSKPDWHCDDYWWPNFATPDRNVN